MIKTTITGTSRLTAGDVFIIEVPDENKWRRFVAWVLRRKAPTRLQSFRVTGQVSETTLDIEPHVW